MLTLSECQPKEEAFRHGRESFRYHQIWNPLIWGEQKWEHQGHDWIGARGQPNAGQQFSAEGVASG